MKIKFLGTSAGWPLPRLGCQCEICQSTDPKDKRTRTQILIDDQILLDAGPETYQHLNSLDSIAEFTLNKNKRSFSVAQDDKGEGLQNGKKGETQNDRSINISHKLKAVLISHAHPDHILGLWDLPHIYGRAENNIDKINLYVTQPVLNGIRPVFSTLFHPIKPVIVKPNEPFYIDHVKVEYFPVVHGRTPAFGIKLKSNKIFVYITDFNRILPSQQKLVKYADYWAIDGSSLGKIGQGPGHISIQDGIQISKKLKIKNTYFIHIGHKTGTHEYLEDYLRQNLPRRQAGAGSNFHIAFDGLELLV